uniref:Uncharacterized protein n=1 Tax=Setaria viridis TaxID=4556 RepID=A0A4U6UF17_SETVI|nr:hypothetical protein SEVIR_5G180350v2 [Setaria viridis]
MTPRPIFIPHRRRRWQVLPAPSSSRIGAGGGPALSPYASAPPTIPRAVSVPHRRGPRARNSHRPAGWVCAGNRRRQQQPGPVRPDWGRASSRGR